MYVSVHVLGLQEMVIINPMADGRCFWSCLYLWSSGGDIRNEWLHQERSSQGFPEESRRVVEKEVVHSFVSEIMKSALANPESEEILGSGAVCFVVCVCVRTFVYIYIYI